MSAMLRHNPATRAVRLPRSQLSLRPQTILRITPSQLAQIRIISTRARPVLPFLSTHSYAASEARRYASQQSTRAWIRSELKWAAKICITLWVGGASLLLIWFALFSEAQERAYPTPPEWQWIMRKYARDIHQKSEDRPHIGEPADWVSISNWGTQLLQNYLENPETSTGEGVKRLSEGFEDAQYAYVAPADISAKSEEWRRGYFKLTLLIAKAMEYTEGFMRDTTRQINFPPKYVIGPSNPRPQPVAKDQPHAPREEDCVLSYPAPGEFYHKLANTVGFTSKQKLDIRLQEAVYWEYKDEPEKVKRTFQECIKLLEEQEGSSRISQWVKVKDLTPLRRSSGNAPSQNILDVVTAIADYHGRTGRTSDALTAYVSLLHARRTLPPVSDEPPRKKALPWYSQGLDLFKPPPYPAPPRDGTQIPWRSPEQRCQESGLQLHIGEIIYATSSKEEGLAWTRDGVDVAEEQMRSLTVSDDDLAPRRTCRQCLGMGLENWSLMVGKLAAEERRKMEEKAAKEEKEGAASKGWGLGLWKGEDKLDGRWQAEEKVVAERVERTKEMILDVAPQQNNPLASVFRA